MKTYLRHKIANVVAVKELVALEYLDFEGKYRNYEEMHSFWEICYVQKGRITLTADGICHTLQENQLMVIPPEQLHSYRSEAGNESRVFVICFESISHAMKPLRGARFQTDIQEQHCLQQIVEESAATFFMDAQEHLAVQERPCFGGRQAVFLLLEYLLIRLLRRPSPSLVFLKDESFHSDLAMAVTRYFRENLEKKLTIEEVCNRFNYSRSFLCKAFKEQTGESLLSCFNRLKIEEAQRLLDRTTMSAVEISCLLGFSEAKYFGTFFKKHVGLSPIAYRNREVQDHETDR